ncbi:MAG: ABC transporter substrate-binding protein [Acidimicrobiales bacterium]
MTRLERGPGWRWAAVAGVMVLSACTTVSRTALENAQGSVGAGSAAGQTGGTQQGATAGANGPNGVSGPNGASSLSTVPGGGQGPSGGDSSLSPGAVVSGGTASRCTKPVKIGVSYSSDESSGLALVGNPGAATQNGNYVQQQQQLYQRAVDDLNRRGGLAGCKVVLGFHDFKSLGSDGFSGESESECVDFAEDQHVFAVINTTLENKTLVTCLAQHHVVDLYYGSTYQVTAQDFAQYRSYIYEPAGINPYRWAPFIDQLAGSGYFPHGTKVGILLADDGSGTNQYLVNNIWKPKLAALGITPVVFAFTQIEGFSDVSNATSQFSSAVLRFKAAQVDHVMATPDAGDTEIFFTQVAQSQNYHPRYAFSTANAPAAWSTEPAGQRPGALNISYSLLDLGLSNPSARQMATNPASPARARCEALYKGHTGSSAVSFAYGICDAMNFLAAGLAGASSITPAALVAGVERLGSGFSLADGYAPASFGPAHYDGGVATRVMAWNESALEWQYTSSPQTVP